MEKIKNVIIVILAMMSVIFGIIGYIRGKNNMVPSSSNTSKVPDTFYKQVFVPDTSRRNEKQAIPVSVTEYRNRYVHDTIFSVKAITDTTLQIVTRYKTDTINVTTLKEVLTWKVYPIAFNMNADTIRFTTVDTGSRALTKTYKPNFRKYGYQYLDGNLKTYKYKPHEDFDAHNKNFTLSTFVGYDPLNRNGMLSIDAYYLWENIGPKARLTIEQVPGTSQIVVKPTLGIQVDLR